MAKTDTILVLGEKEEMTGPQQVAVARRKSGFNHKVESPLLFHVK
jgi:hypothetical protein